VQFAAVRRAAAPLLLDAQRSPLSSDISCQQGAQQQTRRSGGQMTGQTDGRTPDRFIGPAKHITRTV